MDDMRKVSEQSMRRAADVLRQGGVVVFPTETSYGLAADAASTRAVARVFAIKGRPAEKGVPLIASSLAMAERHAHLSLALRALARRIWPGPLTIVAPRRGRLAPGAVSTDGTVAIRVSSSEIARSLARRLGRPIVATSANRAGMSPAFSADAARQAFSSGLVPDFILDVGALPRQKPSTIVAERDGKLVVLREGAIRIPNDPFA
jgi:L-threonylcarbamoyladenylate synthase